MQSLSNYIYESLSPVVLYHNCDKKDLDSILKNGIKTSYSTRKDNLTHQELKGKTDEIKKVVYLGNKSMADGIGCYRKKHGYSDNEGVTLKIEIPKHVYDKMNFITNPECLNASSLEEYIEIRKKLNPKENDQEIKQRWKVINPPYTITTTDNIDKKYIKMGDIS